MSNTFDKIYQIVKTISSGQTRSYSWVAKQVGTTPRVVGWALHQNPDPANIPCYRVVKKNGQLATGYAFGGKKAQRQKLRREGVII